MGEIHNWKDTLSKNSKKYYKQDELGMSFVEQFKETHAYFQSNTPHIAQASLHLLLGQLPSLKNMRIYVDANYIDTRFHIIWFQPSGTGKGRTFNFVAMMCEGLGLLFKSIHEITDAKLLGGWQKREVHDPQTKGRKIEYDLIPGVLQYGSSNILAMNEAGILFNMKPTPNSKNTMDYYQIAMNTIGTADNVISKDVLHGGGTINCQPDCSLFLSSYIPERYNEVIAGRGFAARAFNIINDVGGDLRYEAMIHSAKHFNIHREKAYENLSDLVSKMYFINNYYKGTKGFPSHKNVKAPLMNFVSEIHDTVSDIGKFHRSKLEEFMHRYLDMCYKIMYHSCCLRLGDEIEAQDVIYAERFLLPVWKSFINYLEESMHQSGIEKGKELNIRNDVMEAYEGLIKGERKVDINGYVPRPLIKKILKSEVWHCSTTTAEKRLKFVEELGIIIRKKYRRTPMIKVMVD